MCLGDLVSPKQFQFSHLLDFEILMLNIAMAMEKKIFEFLLQD